MIKAAFYRHRDTGALHGADAIRKAARRFTVNGKRAMMILPGNPGHWSDHTLGRLGYDAVEKTAPPTTDPERETLNGRGAEQVDGRWRQKWVVNDRYKTREEAEVAVLRKLHRIAEEKRDGGVPVLLDGQSPMSVRTDLVGVTRITGAKMGGKGVRRYVLSEEETRDLTAEHVDKIFQAVDDHVQGCFDRWADLIDAVKAADDPFSVDLTAGWPGDE